ncbi:MAG: proliferating cell nuclear antigen (pcna), partial [Candidatus Caldarchaeum sp.]|nr:proliferating cell nuclear antigen (pcna) [Candidatus Caldarchaeum sp.]
MSESTTPFRLKLPSADYFSGLVKAISSVVDEGSFTADKDSLRLTGMDPAHVSMVNFSLGRDAAEEYVCEKTTEIRLNITELLKFLRRAGNESLTLEYDENTRKLRIVLANTSARKERTFVMNTLESVSSPTPVPRLTFDAKCRVETSAFYEAINDASLVSDYTKITITPSYLLISSKSDVGVNQTKLEKEGSLVYEISTEKEVSASFSLTYLEKIMSSSKSLSNETGIELSTNRPIKLSFPITAGKIEFL